VGILRDQAEEHLIYWALVYTLWGDTMTMHSYYLYQCTALLGWSLGFRGVSDSTSAHVLHQPTSCRSEYFYNHVHSQNLIGTDIAWIEVSVELRIKQAKSNSEDGFRIGGISNGSGIQIMEVGCVQYRDQEQSIPIYGNQINRSQMRSEVTRVE